MICLIKEIDISLSTHFSEIKGFISIEVKKCIRECSKRKIHQNKREGLKQRKRASTKLVKNVCFQEHLRHFKTTSA
jgi:hypothetical protein